MAAPILSQFGISFNGCHLARAWFSKGSKLSIPIVKSNVFGEVISDRAYSQKQMNEIYIDNPDAIAIEIAVDGLRLTIGNTTCAMPNAIARKLALTIQSQLFAAYQIESGDIYQRQLSIHRTRSLFKKNGHNAV